MADNARAKSAKERLDAAKKAAEEAEILEAKTAEAPEGADETSLSDAVATDAAEEATPLPDEAGMDADSAVGDGDGAADAAPEGEAANNSGEVPDPSAESDASDTEARTEPEREPEPERKDHRVEEVDDASGSLAATILKFIVILVVGAAAALWAGPRIAPNLPGWASPVANFLTPGANQAAQRVDAVAAEIQEQREALSSEIEAAMSAASAADAKASDASAAVQQARADLGAKIDDVAKEPRADLERMNDLATRLVAAEATVEGLRAEIDALNSLSTGDAAPSAEVLERVAAFGASVEGLRAEIADLKARTAQIEALAKSEDLAALTARVAALEESEAATAEARDEASDIRRAANIDAAMIRIEQALQSGASYAPALADAASLSGESAPAALSDNAAAGVPTQESLVTRFPAAAQAAYAAALKESAGDGFAGGVLAKLQGRLGGRPSVETAGDDAGAVLSRVEARLKEGRLGDALSEADGLSDTARTAMAGWLGDLTRATEAAAALSTYRNAVTAN